MVDKGELARQFQKFGGDLPGAQFHFRQLEYGYKTAILATLVRNEHKYRTFVVVGHRANLPESFIAHHLACKLRNKVWF